MLQLSAWLINTYKLRTFCFNLDTSHLYLIPIDNDEFVKPMFRNYNNFIAKLYNTKEVNYIGFTRFVLKVKGFCLARYI